MWGRKRQPVEAARPSEPQPERLKDALRKARVDQAERTAVVVDLHDAEVARLELLDEALDPCSRRSPKRSICSIAASAGGRRRACGSTPSPMSAMGRDKRMYRFLQDTRYGRRVLAESGNIPEIVEAVTKYLAQRLIERERALADGSLPALRDLKEEARLERRRRRRRAVKAFVLGLLAGCAILIAAALLFGPKP